MCDLSKCIKKCVFLHDCSETDKGNTTKALFARPFYVLSEQRACGEWGLSCPDTFFTLLYAHELFCMNAQSHEALVVQDLSHFGSLWLLSVVVCHSAQLSWNFLEPRLKTLCCFGNCNSKKWYNSCSAGGRRREAKLRLF